jgi:hypothetical protein
MNGIPLLHDWGTGGDDNLILDGCHADLEEDGWNGGFGLIFWFNFNLND